MKDWIKHVRRSDTPVNAWCGKLLTMQFCFQDAEHAALNGANQGRLVVCKDCYKAIIKSLANGHE